MTVSNYPEIVPILDETEMCIGPLNPSSGCGCLVYWTGEVFLDRLSRDTKADWEKRRAIEYLVDKALVAELGVFVTNYGDDKEFTPKQVAAGWNRAMRRLGYVVPCDRE